MKKILLLLLLCCFTAAMLTGCAGGNHRLHVTPGSLSLTPGDSAPLSVTCTDEKHTAFRYESSDEGVATVDESGLVTAVAQGKATVTAICEEGSRTAKAECIVSVDLLEIDLKLQNYEGSLTAGGTCRLTATVLKNDHAVSDVVTWHYDDSGTIARIRENGNLLTISGISPGEITITASFGRAQEQSVSLRVTSGTDYRLSLSDTALQLYPGESAALTAQVYAGETPWSGPVTWSSSNTAVATVSPEGGISAVSPGSAIITASAVPGDGETLKAPCLITVNENDYELTIEYTEAVLYASENIRLKASLTRNEKPYEGVLTWSVNDPAAATVEADGSITLLSPGFVTVIVTYTSPEGKEIRDSLQLRIMENDYAISLSDTSLSLSEGEESQLKAMAEKNGETYGAEFFWLSSDSDILTVDDTGLATALAEGTATVTVSYRKPMAEGGDTVETTASVTVKPIVYTLELSASADSVWVGESLNLSARCLKDGKPTEGEVSYQLSDLSFAELKGGVLTGQKPGDVTVSAFWTDPKGVTHSQSLAVGVRSRYYLTLEPTEISLSAGSELQFSAETLQRMDDGSVDDCYEGSVSWQSSDENVATVSGGVLKVFRPGATAVITAAWTAPDGTVAVARCTVTVTEAVNNGYTQPKPSIERIKIFIGSHELDKSNSDLYNYEIRVPLGYSYTLSYTVVPESRQEGTEAVWSSEDTGVVSILQTGKITGMSTGISYIHCKVENVEAIVIVHVE